MRDINHQGGCVVMRWLEIGLAALVATIVAIAVNVGVYNFLTKRRASQ